MIPEIFYTNANDYIYSGQKLRDPKGQNCYLPIDIDTEFEHPPYNINSPNQVICTNLTAQCRAITQAKGMIFADTDIEDIARHPVWRSGCVVVDYLQALGHKAKLSRQDDPTVEAWIQIDLYAFFAVAELSRIFKDEFLKDILLLCSNPTNHQGIEEGRRIRTYTNIHQFYYNWVLMPKWILELNGIKYRVRLSIYDTCAVHGNVSYKNFCANTGIKLEYKDIFTSNEKAVMRKMYIERPEDFDNYALGDLYNHPALMANVEKFKLIYESLGLDEYFTPPRLTIGATVGRLLEASIKKLFGSDSRENINQFCRPGTADKIKRLHTTGCLNAKVDGGRCRNNRPTNVKAEGALCDIDIFGCYGEGLRVQLYPLGTPIIIDYPLKSPINKYQTLRQFLKKYRAELVPGLWQARVSTPEGYQLKYPQDYLISWKPPKDISKMVSDGECIKTSEWWTIDNVGMTKIFTHEVHLGVITEDFIQWLDNVASTRQRKELLDNLIVVTAMYYPATQRVDSIEQLIDKYNKHPGKNRTLVNNVKVKGSKKDKDSKEEKIPQKVSIEQECHAWYGINMGELLVNQLLIERKKYPKPDPLNTLYKLCINTVYGDMVSPFFIIGNVVVGNNITARARTLAWCMEKGLHGWQTITDGCAFDLNQVLYFRDEQRITGENTVNVYCTKPFRYSLAALDKCDHIEIRTVDEQAALTLHKNGTVQHLTPKEASTWVNAQAMTHLQNLFPGLDVLHKPTKAVDGKERPGQFEFECKGFFTQASFHGTANYCLSFDEQTIVRMRGHSRKPHKIVALTTDELQIISEESRPSNEFLIGMVEGDIERLVRGYVFIESKVLKVGDYRKNFTKWNDTSVLPGYSIESASIIKEFSLSQFTFHNFEQYQAWLRESEQLRRRYGQTYEMFFLNKDGTLNYQQMAKEIDEAIQTGKKGWFDGMNRRKAHTSRMASDHQEKKTLELTRAKLGMQYGWSAEEPEDEQSDDVLEEP